jgi:hypothetical protein
LQEVPGLSKIKCLVELVNSVPQIKIVVAPHELHEKTYLYYENEVKGKVVRFSKTVQLKAAEAKVLLLIV